MDQNTVRGIINKLVIESDFGSVEVFFEQDDALRLEIVSNKFKGMRLLSRLAVLSELFLDLATTQLSDFHLVFNPLTVNEKLHGVSELSEADDAKKDASGVAASSSFY